MKIPATRVRPAPKLSTTGTTMSLPPTSDEPWRPCPPGTLRDIERRRTRRNRVWSVAVAGVPVCVLAALIVNLAPWRPAQPATLPPMLSCSEVNAMWPAYRDGTLSSEDAYQVNRHLDGCPDCRQGFATHAVDLPDGGRFVAGIGLPQHRRTPDDSI